MIRYIRFVPLFIGLSLSLSLRGNDCINDFIEQDGKLLNVSEIITSPATVTLSLKSGTSKGNWNISMLTEDGSYAPVQFEEDGKGGCTINPNDTRWGTARRIFNKELNRNVFQLKAEFSGEHREEIDFYWALLPTIPVISDVEFIYEFDWTENDIFPNGYLSWDIYSEDASRYWINVTESFLFKHPGYYIWCQDFDASSGPRIGYEAEWGEYVAIDSSNSFGYAHGEVLFTTSYIHDPDVLERINEIERSGVEEIDAEDTHAFSWHNSVLSFDQAVDTLAVYDVSGKLILTVSQTDQVDLSSSTPGVYIVAYTTNNKKHQIKIIKK